MLPAVHPRHPVLGPIEQALSGRPMQSCGVRGSLVPEMRTPLTDEGQAWGLAGLGSNPAPAVTRGNLGESAFQNKLQRPILCMAITSIYQALLMQ